MAERILNTLKTGRVRLANHAVSRDTTFTGHPRVSCVYCDRQVVRQPFMTDAQWGTAVQTFLARHPAQKESEP